MRGTRTFATISILLIGVLSKTPLACPACVGRVSKTSPAFFEDACYQLPTPTTENKNTAVEIATATQPEQPKEEKGNEPYE